MIDILNIRKSNESKYGRLFFKFAVCGLFPLFLFPSLGMGTTWVILRGPDKDVQHAYDRDRLRIEGQNITFWRRIRFKKPQSSEFGEVGRGIYQERIDCQNQTLQTLFVGLYDAQRRPILERSMAEATQSAIILPESIGELFQTILCRYATMPSPSTTSRGSSPSTSGRPPATTFIPQRRPVIVDTPPPASLSPVPVPVAPPVAPSSTPTLTFPIPALPSIPPTGSAATPIVPPLVPSTTP